MIIDLAIYGLLMLAIFFILKFPNNINVLLWTLFIFFIGSIGLLIDGHPLIASTFVLVYIGAIMVFMTITYLITPSINSFRETDTLKYINLYKIDIYKSLLITFIISFIIVYIYNLGSNTSSDFYNDVPSFDNLNFIKFKYQKLRLERSRMMMQFYQMADLLDDTRYIVGYGKEYVPASKYKYPGDDIKFRLIIFNLVGEVDAYYLKSIEIFKPIIQTFQKIDFNYSNNISANFQENITIIYGVGIYLFFTLLCCLRIFTFNQQRKLIKRQDSADQILARC